MKHAHWLLYKFVTSASPSTRSSRGGGAFHLNILMKYMKERLCWTLSVYCWLFQHQNCTPNKYISRNLIVTTRHYLTSNRMQTVATFRYFENLLLDTEDGLLLKDKAYLHPSPPAVIPTPLPEGEQCCLKLESCGFDTHKSLHCCFRKRPRHWPHLQPNLLTLFLKRSSRGPNC